jgi:hypothetical protein
LGIRARPGIELAEPIVDVSRDTVEEERVREGRAKGVYSNHNNGLKKKKG